MLSTIQIQDLVSFCLAFPQYMDFVHTRLDFQAKERLAWLSSMDFPDTTSVDVARGLNNYKNKWQKLKEGNGRMVLHGKTIFFLFLALN